MFCIWEFDPLEDEVEKLFGKYAVVAAEGVFKDTQWYLLQPRTFPNPLYRFLNEEKSMANSPQELQARRNTVDGDLAILMDKEKTYDGSWKKRGGVGAYFTLVRPLDRFCQMVEKKYKFDLFDALEIEDVQGRSGQDGSVLAALRDLRCYLILVESEFMLRRQAYASPPKEIPEHEALLSRLHEARRHVSGDSLPASVITATIEYLERKLP